MSGHTDFILTSICIVLDDAIIATSGIGRGIETNTLRDYVLQTTFLKMTGFQEQKMRCIAWEMATNDYEYRRRLLNDDDSLGEYSSYKAKNMIYKHLIALIKKEKPDFTISKVIDKRSLIKNTMAEIKNTFNGSVLSKWDQRGFDYICNSQFINPNQLCPENGTQLFENVLQGKYEGLYDQRNRIAHNTLSYQHNVPTLKTLVLEDDESRNYFVWFAILMLIDNIFINLYKIYKEMSNTSM